MRKVGSLVQVCGMPFRILGYSGTRMVLRATDGKLFTIAEKDIDEEII